MGCVWLIGSHCGNVCDQIGNSRQAGLREMNLVAHPLCGSFHAIVSISVVWRIDSSRRRREVTGVPPVKCTAIDPELTYPAQAQCFNSGEGTKEGRSRRLPDRA